MKKTEEQRLTIARDYHCGAIERARHLVALLVDTYFSSAPDFLNKEEERLLEAQLMAGYETIAAGLNTVCDILFAMENDLDAARGLNTSGVQFRRETLKAIYGLTEDKEEAAPSATNTQSGK